LNFPKLKAPADNTFLRSHALLVLAIAGMAWSQMFWGDRSGLFVAFLEWSQHPQMALHVIWLMDWLLMCTAMMLPTALPMLAAMRRTVAAAGLNGALVWWCGFGFLAAWAVFGALWRLGWVALVQWLPATVLQNPQTLGVLLALSGGFLLSSYATRCVHACRSPQGFIARFWGGSSPHSWQATHIGLQYGLSCIGCCWPLMTMMGLLGWGSAVGMLGLTLLMTVQKFSVYGAHITKLLGLGLMGLGLSWVLGWTNPPSAALNGYGLDLMSLCFTP
jgi:predicted metal-binding membrane protein